MTSSGNDRRHAKHSVTNGVLICHICDKSVKDSRLFSHLLFGSLQCKDCKFKFRYCRDFDAFQKSKDDKKTETCVHQTLNWTRDPVEYIERKLTKELAKSKPEDEAPTIKEVKKGLVSYAGKLKPIECRSPWRCAIEKLKKYVCWKDTVSRPHDKATKKISQNGHNDERDKCAKISQNGHNDERDKCAKKGDNSHHGKHHESKSKEKKEIYSSMDTTQLVSEELFVENDKQERNLYTNDVQSVTETIVEECMIPQCVEEDEQNLILNNLQSVTETIVEECMIPQCVEEDEQNLILNNLQSVTETVVEECMIPQCVEEVIIPQTDWEVDVVSLGEFEGCDKSVAIYLSNGGSDDATLAVEEVYVTKNEELGLITLIIDDSEFNSEAERNLEIECSSETETSAVSECSSEAEMNTEEIQGNLVISSNEGNCIIDPSSPLNASEADVHAKKAEHQEEVQNEIRESKEKSSVEMAESDEEFFEDKIYCRTDVNDNKLKALALICESRRRAEIKRELNEKLKMESHSCNSKQFPKKLSNSADMQGIVHKVEILPKLTRLKNDPEKNTKTNKHPKKEKLQKRRSYRLKNVVGKNSQGRRRGRPRKYLRSNENNALKPSKYNLRSRGNQISFSFLQRLNAYEKKKLWEKLLPTARKLRKLVAEDGGSSSPFYMPDSSEEHDDDFLVDVLLSQVLNIQQLNKVALMSPEGKDETSYLLNQVRNAIRQFPVSVDIPRFSDETDSSRPFTDLHFRSESSSNSSSESVVDSKRNGTKCFDRMVFGKDSAKRQIKTFYVSPPSDGNYYVISYPSQPLITECPMCYFRVFPAMFSLNLVTNLATTKCVGCTLTIYVVQEPDDNNSLPRIVFTADEDSCEDDPNAPKPARYKEQRNYKPQRKVSARNFFKQ